MADLSLTLVLRDPDQAALVIRCAAVPKCHEIWATGQAVEATFRAHEDAKTDRQRRYYHGIVLKCIADQARPNGQKFPLAVWKEHFRSEYLGFKTMTAVNPMTGKKSRRRVRISTEDLGVRAYSHLIDRASAFAATELGVSFPATYEQWEMEHIDPDTGEIVGGAVGC